MKALRHWFGDDTETEEDSTDSDTTEWGIIDRRKANKLKKKKHGEEKETKSGKDIREGSPYAGNWANFYQRIGA